MISATIIVAIMLFMLIKFDMDPYGKFLSIFMVAYYFLFVGIAAAVTIYQKITGK